MDWLLKRFVKNYQHTNNLTVRVAYGKLGAITGIFSNVFLLVIKLVAGLLSGSIAIIGDAVNSISDSASSIVALIGFKMAAKPADAKHPYGHQRIEYISGFIVAILILIVGVQLGINSVKKIIAPVDVYFNLLTIIILVVSILIKVFQGRFYKFLGKKINSLTLLASASDSYNDVATTSAILVGAIITMVAKINIDGYLGLLVSIFILISAIQLIKVAINPLIGVAPDPAIVNAIIKEAKNNKKVLGVHDCVCHMYGEHKMFASLHVEVDANDDVLQSHDMIDKIENTIKDKYGVDLVIHMDPIVMDDPEINRLRGSVTNLVAEMAANLSFHDFRVVKGYAHSKLIFDILRPVDCKYNEKEITDFIQQHVKAIDQKYEVVICFDTDYLEHKEEEK